MNFLRPTFSRTRPFPGSPFEVLRGVTTAERERAFSGRYAFCVITNGEVEIESAGRRFVVSAGQGTLLDPVNVHTSRTLTPSCDFVVVLVAAHVVESARRRLDLDRDTFMTTFYVHDRAATAAMLAFAEAIEDIAEEDIALDRLDEALGAVASLRLPTLPHSDAVDLIDLADVHLRTCTHQRVTLDDLEAVTGETRLSIIRAFLAQLGATPVAYHLGLRLDDARRRIDGGMTVFESAMQTGFRSQGEFTRLFRRQYGFSPDRWARQSAPATPGATPARRPMRRAG